MARPLRIEYPGAVYHVRTRGNNRQAIFRDEADRQVYLATPRHYCGEKAVELLWYCLLLNHIHLLVETPHGNLSTLMQALQTSSTRYVNRRHGRIGHVFEQRYKAFLVDRDNYLLQVSRYIHLNPVAAHLVRRPQAYRWSSYPAYLKATGEGGLTRESILGQLTGTRQERMAQYQAFVEGALRGDARWGTLPIRQQVFIGGEKFVEAARRNAKRQPGAPGGACGLQEILRGVGAVVGLTPDQVQRPGKDVRTQRGRELFMYVARRHSAASLREITARLGVRDIATVSHGVRRAERRLEEEGAFGRQVQRILRRLSHSRIQA